MGAPDAFAPGLVPDLVHRDVVPLHAESVHHFFVAFLAPHPELFQRGQERRVIGVDEESHDVDVLAEEHGREFHPGHRVQRRAGRRREEPFVAGDRVVVGQRGRFQTHFQGGGDEFFRRHGAVGAVAVHVEIDHGFPA